MGQVLRVIFCLGSGLITSEELPLHDDTLKRQIRNQVVKIAVYGEEQNFHLLPVGKLRRRSQGQARGGCVCTDSEGAVPPSASPQLPRGRQPWTSPPKQERALPQPHLHAWGVPAKRGSRTLIHRQLLPQPPGGKHQNHPAEDFETVFSLLVPCARRFAFLL